MRKDIQTVMWKESKSLLRYSDNRWKGIAILVTPIALFGILLPIQFMEGWLTSGWSLGIAFFTPLLLIASTIAESFAGERERHTQYHAHHFTGKWCRFLITPGEGYVI